MKLMNNLSIEQRMNTEWGDKFYPEQCAEILDGARLGVNAEAYANPDYDHGIMKEIKVGLLQDPSLEKYVDAFVHRKNTLVSMKDMSLFVEKNVNIDVMLQLECHTNIFRTMIIMMLKDYDFSTCENSDDVMFVFDMYVEITNKKDRNHYIVKRYIDDLNIMKLRGLE